MNQARRSISIGIIEARVQIVGDRTSKWHHCFSISRAFRHPCSMFALTRPGPDLRSHASLTGVRISTKKIAYESGLVGGTVRLSGLVGGGYVGCPFSRAAHAAV